MLYSMTGQIKKIRSIHGIASSFALMIALQGCGMETFNTLSKSRVKSSLSGNDSSEYSWSYARKSTNLPPRLAEQPSETSQKSVINVCHNSQIAFRVTRVASNQALSSNEVASLSIQNSYFRTGGLNTYFYTDRGTNTSAFGVPQGSPVGLTAYFNENGLNAPVVMVARLPGFNAQSGRATFYDADNNFMNINVTQASAEISVINPNGTVELQEVEIYTPNSSMCSSSGQDDGYFQEN